MSSEPIVRGQRVNRDKVARAREFRRNMSPAEAVLWQRLRRHGAGGLHFRRQQVVDGFIVDFYCHTARLVVEVDGGFHATQPSADAERDRILMGRGLRILRFWTREVEQDLAGVLTRIAAACSPGDGRG